MTRVIEYKDIKYFFLLLNDGSGRYVFYSNSANDIETFSRIDEFKSWTWDNLRN